MGAGRPHKEIDARLFEKLCALQCTLNEICSVFDCDNKTLESWCKREYDMNFSEVFKLKRQVGKVSLRRAQYQKAVDDKNTAMLIFLGKNWLGQSDRVDVSGVKDTAFSNSFDLTKLSTEELQMLKEISLKANANVDGTTEIGSNRKRTRKKTTSRAKKSER